MEAPKFVAFSGTGNRLDGQTRPQPIEMGSKHEMAGMSEEELLQQAIAMSIQDQRHSTGAVGDSQKQELQDAQPMTDKERKDQLRRERLAALEKRGLK